MPAPSSNRGPNHQPNEYTSLVSKPIDDGPPWNDSEENESPFSRPLILAEFWILLKDSIPVILAYTLQNSLQTVSVLIIGRSSPENLAASAFSQMFAMVTAWMIALGGTTAMDTLASSSFTGSSNKHDLGILLQRGFFVLGIMRAGTYVLLIILPLNAGLNFLFCYTFEIGLLGAPLATGLCYWLSFALLVLYARFINGSECWGGWSREAFQNLHTFARLALLGVVHVGTEWWAFEIVALAAGRLGTVSLAAQSVIMTADQVLNTIPFGIGVATSGRVGNLLGKRDDTGAARAAHISAMLSMVLAIFNGDSSVVSLTAEVLPYVALFQIADGLNGSCGGSLRGMGRQHVGALVNLVSYYCGALPLGIWLAFHGWGLKGLWVGQCIALYLVGVFEWVIVARSRWDTEVQKAFQRMDVHETLEDGI
ncbi:hypothetical protein N7519_001190 [Penicillium mononematosum]|uniref:uncharacterized protein n=1 Tax=Penicillium mononematosum TaxID=268346 RepID=UPI002546C8A3|nr:uncharacterized protein N7519_001190 [Penicillium mononematosum]KAJ6191169.1 hypothetical protein N7519_001190 [Penicillium mononematosum]